MGGSDLDVGQYVARSKGIVNFSFLSAPMLRGITVVYRDDSVRGGDHDATEEQGDVRSDSQRTRE